MSRRLAFAVAAALVAAAVPLVSSADGPALIGEIPAQGGVGLAVFTGGPVEALEAAAATAGCTLTSLSAMDGGAMRSHVAGAPAFVNAGFAAHYAGGIAPGTPVLLACADKRTTLGTSVQGRPIEVGCVGSGRTALLVGGMHTGPNEVVTATLARELANLAWHGRLVVPSGTRLCIVPELNPDGIALGRQTNANEVDLNRNWPGSRWRPDAWHPETGAVSGGVRPLSEPETRALYEYIVDTRPAVVIVLHCCGAVVEANESPRAITLAERYATASGLRHIEHWNAYTITGQFIDAMDRIAVAAIDVEMAHAGDPAVTQHRAGLLAVLEALAAGVP